MTNEEAIYELETNVDYKTPAIKEACQMAIKALEQQPCEEWYDTPSDDMTLEQARQAVKDLRKKLAEYLEQKPCDMKQRVEKEYLYESLCEDLKRANAEIKRLLEPFEDAISRQAVLDTLDKMDKALDTDRTVENYKELLTECYKDLPPVTPKEKTRWIPVSERLPEKDGCYLVTTTGTNNDIIDIAYYTDDIWHKASRIKAWMPLPEPFKAESEDTDGNS